MDNAYICVWEWDIWEILFSVEICTETFRENVIWKNS